MICLGGYGSSLVLAREIPGGLAVESTVECPANPTYLAASPDGRFLYASHELDEGRLSAFALGAGGAVSFLGDVRSGGVSPIHLSVHAGHVLTAHWGSSDIAVHPVLADGSLGTPSHVLDTGKATVHWVGADPSGRWVVAVHLGLGRVTTYAFVGGRLEQHHVASGPPDAGPRHLAFHPLDERVYVVNELHSTLTAGTFVDGVVTLGRTVSTLPGGVETANHPSAVRVTSDGRFVLVANRFHDSVAVFTPELDLLATYPCGEFPRDLALRGSRLYVANERAGEVVAFAFTDGVPTRLGERTPPGEPTAPGVPLAVPGVACVLPL